VKDTAAIYKGACTTTPNPTTFGLAGGFSTFASLLAGGLIFSHSLLAEFKEAKLNITH
jgi:hypothetical protein